MNNLGPLDFMGLFVALMLDVAGILSYIIGKITDPVIGQFLSYIPDVIGAVFFSIWITIRGGGIKKALKNKKRFLKTAMTFIAEAFPFIDIGLAPIWLIYVIIEIKNG